MYGRIVFIITCFVFIGFILYFSALHAEIKEIKAEDLIGRETLNFYLPSTEDNLMHYGDEFYGTYYLIMTFFPAAFTPV